MWRKRSYFAYEMQKPREAEITQDEFRQKDDARKRAAYWTAKQQSAQSAANGLPPTDSCSLISNRSNSSIVKAITSAVEHILRTLGQFNEVDKKEFFKKFWLHHSVKRFQPAKFGCAKVDASVSATLADLRQSMKIVKTARRKDHLATKQAVLTALVGQSTVGQRYQSSLAKALGIKRQNMHKAAKQRETIDADVAVRYPMGERKVRSDKISAEVVEVVEKYWEANTRILPCAKDKAQRRLAPKIYEVHCIHWLENTEVSYFKNISYGSRYGIIMQSLY